MRFHLWFLRCYCAYNCTVGAAVTDDWEIQITFGVDTTVGYFRDPANNGVSSATASGATVTIQDDYNLPADSTVQFAATFYYSGVFEITNVAAGGGLASVAGANIQYAVGQQITATLINNLAANDPPPAGFCAAPGETATSNISPAIPTTVNVGDKFTYTCISSYSKVCPEIYYPTDDPYETECLANNIYSLPPLHCCPSSTSFG